MNTTPSLQSNPSPAMTMYVPSMDHQVEEATVDAMWVSIQDLQIALHAADQAAIKANGVIPEPQANLVRKRFDRMVFSMHDALGPESGRSEGECKEIGEAVQRAVLPYLLLTTTSERLYSKPRGYAGDAISIDGIYANQPSGTGRIGPLLDECFLEQPAARAVRNRRGLLREEIQAMLTKFPQRTVHITSMACGPAREIFDVFEEMDDVTKLQVQLIDIDTEALEQVHEEARKRDLLGQISFHHANLIELSIGRTKLDLPAQDLVYSIGLIDYFIDKLVVRLMSYGHQLLRCGGKMILGNFHPCNRNKALMDFVLDWKLIHRTEADMDRLYSASGFATPSTEQRYEDAGVNLFASCLRR